jgi:hypothetical protein
MHDTPWLVQTTSTLAVQLSGSLTAPAPRPLQQRSVMTRKICFKRSTLAHLPQDQDDHSADKLQA